MPGIGFSCDFLGVDEFYEALLTFDSALVEDVRRKLEMWAQTVGDIARARVPVRSGYLRSTIYARIRGWVAEVGAEAAYSMFVEFGTRYMRARPFLFPAIQSYLPVLEQIILEAIDMAKMEAGL